ncbi:MAG: hypothetical protein GY834_10725 [Bacteroidetes bacterium]|nr:hypothetical protein [Bacteroidota bacterium]
MIDRFHEWRRVAETLKRAKADEMRLRKEIVADILKGAVAPASKTILIDQHKVKASSKVTYSLDESLINMIFKEFTDGEKNALKFKPDLRLREYKKLTDSRLLIHDTVTIKPAAPTLEIK